MCDTKNEAEATLNKDYVDNQFNQLTLSDMYKCKMQVRGGVGGVTSWMDITNEQAKAIHAILAGDRVLGHDPSRQIAVRWHIDDVLGERPHLTQEQAMGVLAMADKNHDATIGINWDVLKYWADDLYPEDVHQ